MKCFHHNDMDGICAGAIVNRFYKEDKTFKETGEDMEFFSIDYRHAFPFDQIRPNEAVVIVDFSLEKPEDFKKLLEITDKVIWIDHHKTAIEKHGDLDLEGIRKDGTAGCVLTWIYFFPRLPTPPIVEMLGAYDIWDFSKYGEDLNRLQTGIRLYDTDPQHKNWRAWINGEEKALKPLLEEGDIALRYRNKMYASLVNVWSFRTKFEGHDAICCNAGSVSSQLFDSINENIDLMITFVFDGSQWKVSVYSKNDKIDCSAIAKKYGGGGHQSAAGFQCKDLPFKKEDR